jgi:hypothetical protein
VVFEQFGQLFLGVLESAGVAGVDYEGDGVDVRVEGAPVAAGLSLAGAVVAQDRFLHFLDWDVVDLHSCGREDLFGAASEGFQYGRLARVIQSNK